MTPRLMLLVSLRAQVDALIALEEADAGLVPPAGECPHPDDKRRDASVMGEPRKFLCLACGQTVEGVA